MSDTSTPLVAFQGAPGAYSELACRNACPEMKPMPVSTFEDTFSAVADGSADLAMIPIENSVAGRVADIHRILPESGLFIVGEYFQRVNHQLLAPKGAHIESLQEVHSHVQALSQCRTFILRQGLTQCVHGDTAGAARDVAEAGDTHRSAIASELAAEIYGLEVLATGIEDAGHNTTRFLMMAREQGNPPLDQVPVMTTFVFRVRNVPAALYKALGGFATNGVNMLKLESYMIGGSFSATQFYSDIEGHPEQDAVKRSMEELGFFTEFIKILGVYPLHPFRNDR